jgi:PAS domain S-box-containing protein
MKTNQKDIDLKFEELAGEINVYSDNFSFLEDIVGQKKTKEKLIKEEKKLLKNEVKFWQFIECIKEGFWQLDKDGIITYINPGLTEILGYTSEEMLGKDYLSFMDGTYGKKAQIYIQRRKKGTIEKHDFNFLKKDDSKVFTRLEALPIYDEIGSYNGSVAFISDLTEQKIIEDELKEYKDRFRDLDDLLPEAIFETDQKLNIKFANKNFYRISGYSEGDLKKGFSVLKLLSSESLAYAQENIKKIIKGVKTGPNKYKIIKKNGRIVYGLINSNAIYDNEGNFSGLRITGLDITKKKNQEDALKTSEERYESLFKSSLDGIYQTTLEGKYIDINPALIKMLGYSSREELLKVNVAKQIYLSSKARPSIDERGKIFIAQFRKKDSTIIWVEISSRVFYKNGKPDHHEGIVRDITHRIETEENLKLSYEKLQKTLNGAIKTLAYIVETKDPYTSGHQVRVAKLSIVIANELGLSKEKVIATSTASLIHDIGKISVPSSILSKPGTLTDLEFAMVKLHSQIGYDILKEIDFGYPIADIVLQHHERLNGSGYPKGLKGNDIMIEARIIAVADTVESMAAHRPYRPALGIDKALDELEKGRGVLYDKEVVDSCIRVFRENKFKF